MYNTITHALSRIFKTPQYLILFVSDVCWMKCRHCWYNEKWKKEYLKKSQLSFQEIERLADSITRINFLSLTGGEAFLRDDIVAITEMFARKTQLNRYEIPTSGFVSELIVSKTENILKTNKHIPLRIDVSLDGTEETHDYIRNTRGGYKNAINTIRELKRLKQRYSYFDIGIITTVSSDNQDEIKEIASIIEKINPEGEWMVNITRGRPRYSDAANIDVDKYFEAHQIIEKRIQKGCYKGHSGHFLASWLSAKNATRRKVIRDIIKGKCSGGGCAAGSLGGVIFNDGTVYPCEMIEYSFGNIRDYDYNLPDIWNSQKADNIRVLIQDIKCLCTQECFLSVSLLIQPKYWPYILKERIKLFRANIKSIIRNNNGYRR